MKLAIMQPYFFPYIGYWQLINAVDSYVIYDDVAYIKGGWINRNNFLIGGEKKLYTIKLREARSGRPINEIELLDDFVKFKKMLPINYSRAPFLNAVMELISEITSFQSANLAGFLENSIRLISSYLNINTNIILSSSMKKNNALKGKNKVLHICELMGATKYYNAIGGVELYDKSEFSNKGIELMFLKANLQPYTQGKNEFTPGLSIIDVMMYNSIEVIQEMLDDYELT